MSAEDEQKFNGGASSKPAGPKEEYRDEGGRYSDRLSPDASADDETAAQKKVETTERVKTRAEIESQYRNDPRFAMLFEHREIAKKEREWSITVGGLRLTPKRILILCGFFLVILLCLGASLYYALNDIGKYRNYSQACALLEAGDYEGAREMFIKVLREDPNKEGAMSAMAEIYHHFGDWNNEAFFRQRLMRLNPLKPEFLHEYLESAFRARNFGSIYTILNLRLMEEVSLTPDEGALYLISALNSGHASNGRAFYEERRKKDPEYFSGTERGRFAEMLLHVNDLNQEQVRIAISTLDQIKDPQVRFETISVLAYFLSKQGGRESLEQEEKLLLSAVELNEFAGAPLLADYYFSHYRFDDAIKVCDAFLKSRVNAVMPILYGESCILNGQPELVLPLADRIRGLGGRQSRIIASYLDALDAFSRGDDARLQTMLQTAGATVETPLSSLMKLHLALKLDSPKEIQQILNGIMKGRPFMDFQQRARTAALEYLLVKADAGLDEPDQLNACAGIAALIQTPGDDISFLQRIILLDRFNRNVLTEDELQTVLGSFPDDPILLRIAAEFYLAARQSARAMEYISKYKMLDNIPEKIKSSMDVLNMLALDQLGRKSEAEKEFRAFVERGGDETTLFLYFDFCVENGFLDSLKSFAAWLEALPNDSPNRAVLPFVRAEILLREGKKDEALALLEKSPSKEPRLVFYAASRLAEAGRNDAAFQRYISIRDTYPDKALININLSELYFGKGDTKNALACARTAWETDPDHLLTRYIYGKRLFENGRYADVVTVLRFPQYKASFPEDMLKLWANALREQIKADLDKERYTPAMENAKYLLIYFPDDQTGRECVDLIEKLRRHETSVREGM